MLGSFSIGNRYLGAGRSITRPPIKASASAIGAGIVLATESRVFLFAGATAIGAGSAQSAAGRVVSTTGASAIGAGACSGAPSARLRGRTGTALGGGTATAAAFRRVFGAASAIGAGSASADARARRPAAAVGLGAGLCSSNAARLSFGGARAEGAGIMAGAPYLAYPTSATAIGAGSASGNGTLPALSARVTIRIPAREKAIRLPERVRTINYPGDDQEVQVDEFVKQPAEVVDFLLDMTDWFRSIRSDGIDSISVTISPTGTAGDLEAGPGLQPTWEPIGSPAHKARIWIGGGRDGIDYQVTALVTTDEGRVEEVDFLVIVENR